ncbi:unnamed protein product [Knipowitschia caucasica]
MTWSSFIDKLTGEDDECKEAAIYGLDGSLWANSPDFEMSGEEVMKLNDGEAKLSRDGVYLAGVKYLVLQDQLSDNDNPYMLVNRKAEGKTYNCCNYKTKRGK